MSGTDWRALCEELLRHAEIAQSIAVGEGLWDGDEDEGLLDRARAALAQPEPEVMGPSDEEIEEWAEASAEVPLEALDPDLGGWQRCFNSKEFCQMVRAALARWGNYLAKPDSSIDGPAVPESREPAAVAGQSVITEGEVAELVAALLNEAIDCTCTTLTSGDLRRAADLLEQRQAAPVPVAVSERLPQPEDCDAEGRCWVWWKNGVRWVLDEWTHHELREGPLSNFVSHWLPFNALPLPSGEVE